ncbi:hypothetical protein Vretifemale_8856 [Volvox reticuliferus]|uniref:Uncharacterized protein n=1 Tax=Volvox reticuliferus TaxID=1737510 RepID=A0A8J4FNM2_9CHLO|nr:hypothetical protein Vretifemale_8856 [Volvox reticuliferus]
MGNQASSEGGLEQSIDVEENPRAQINYEGQFQGGIFNNPNLIPRNIQFPFGRPDVNNFPSLDEAFRYDPNDIPASTGPSIETVANLYPCSFPEAGLITTGPSAYGGAAQAAVDAYFSRLGESPPTATPCQLPDLPVRRMSESPRGTDCEGPHVIRPAPRWQMAYEPSTTSLSTTYLATGNAGDPPSTAAARDRRTSPAATDSSRTLPAASSSSYPGMEMSRSRLRITVPTVAATAAEPPPGQAARRVLRVANLAATRMDSFSSELSCEELAEAGGAGTAARRDWNTVSVQATAALSPMPAAARAAAPVVSPVRALVPTLPEQAVEVSVPLTALSPVEPAQSASGIAMSDSLPMWSQDPTENGRWNLRAQHQHQQPLTSPGIGGGWIVNNDTAVQQDESRNGEGSGGNIRSPDERLLGSQNDRGGENVGVAGPGNYGATDIGHGGPLTVVGDVGPEVSVRNGDSEDHKMNYYHARNDVASRGEMYISAGGEGRFGVSAGDNGASGTQATGAGTMIGNTDTKCISSGSKSGSGVHAGVSDEGRCSRDQDAVGESLGAVVGRNIAGGDSGLAGGYGSDHSLAGGCGGALQYDPSIRPVSGAMDRGVLGHGGGEGARDVIGGDKGEASTFGEPEHLYPASGLTPASNALDQGPSEALNRSDGSKHGATTATAWRMPRGTWPLVAAHHVDLSRLAWLRHPSAGGTNTAGGITSRPSAPGTFPGPPTDFRRFTDPSPWRGQVPPELLQTTPPQPPPPQQDWMSTGHLLLNSSPTQQPAQQPNAPAKAFRHGADNTNAGVANNDGRDRFEASAEVALGAKRVRLQHLHTPFLMVQKQRTLLAPGGSAGVATAAPANNPAVGSVIGNLGSSQDTAGMSAVTTEAMLPRAPTPRQASHPGTGSSVLAGDGAGGWPPWQTGSVAPQHPDVRPTWLQAPEALTGGYLMGPVHLPEMPTLSSSRLPSTSSQPPAAPQRAALLRPGNDPVNPILWGFLHNYSREASINVPPCQLNPYEAIAPGGAPPQAGVTFRQPPVRAGNPAEMGIKSAAGSAHRQIAPLPPAAPSIIAHGGISVQTEPRLGMWEGTMLEQMYTRAVVVPRGDQRLGGDYEGEGSEGFGGPCWTLPHASRRTLGCAAAVDSAAMPPPPPLPPTALPLPHVPGQWPADPMEYQLEGVRPVLPSASALFDHPMNERPMSVAAAPGEVMRSNEGDSQDAIPAGDGVDSNSNIAALLRRGSFCWTPGDSWALPTSHLQAELSWVSSSGKPGEVGGARQGLRMVGAALPTVEYDQPCITAPVQQGQSGQHHDHAQHPRQQRPGAWLGSEPAQLQVAAPQVQVNVNLDAGALRDVFQQCLQATVPAVCAAAAAAAVLGQGAVQAGATDDRTLHRGGTGAAQNHFSKVLDQGQNLGRNVATQTQSPPRDQAVQTEMALLQPPQPPSSPPFPSLPGHESTATANIAPGARQCQEVPTTWQGFMPGAPVVDSTRRGTASMRSFSPTHSEMLRRTAMATPVVAPLVIPAAMDLGRMASRASSACRGQVPPVSVWSSPDRASGEAVTADVEPRLAARLGTGNDREGGGNAPMTALSSLRGSLSLASFLTPALCQPPMPAETRGTTFTSGVTASNAELQYGVDAVGQAVAAQVSSGPVFHSRAAADLFEECRREIHKRTAVEPARLPDRAPTTSTSGIRPPAVALTSRGNVGNMADSLSLNPIGLPETKRRRLSPLRPTAAYGAASHGIMPGEGTAAVGTPVAAAFAGASTDPGPFARPSSIAALTRADVADGLGLNPALLRYAPPSLASLERQTGASLRAVQYVQLKVPEHEMWLQQPVARMQSDNGVNSPDRFSVGRCPTELEEMVYRSRLEDGMAVAQRGNESGPEAGEAGEQVGSPTHIRTQQSEMLMRFLNGLDQRPM